MGNHISSELRSRHRERLLTQAVAPPAMARVIHEDGRMEEYDRSVRAGNVVAGSARSFLCRGEDMFVGACPLAVAEGDELQPGQLYFVLPAAASRRPISLHDLCRYAGKAYLALQRHRQQGGKDRMLRRR